MKRVAILMILTIVFMSSGFPDKGTWIIDSKSQLTIHGATNVNNFICKVESSSGTDTLEYFKNYATCEIQFLRNRMSIPIRNFDCGSRQISNDFHKTLKSDDFPRLDINFKCLENLSVTNNSFIYGVVDITLAGVTARYKIRYCVAMKGKDTILLTGTHPVNFSDFKLDAPQRLSGLIKVKEVLNVEFNLVLRNG